MPVYKSVNTRPINKGEVVWTMHAEDVANLGETRLQARTAPRALSRLRIGCDAPRHLQTTLGCAISTLVGSVNEEEVRIVSGNPLTGDRTANDGFLGGMHHQVCLLPEGNKPKFLLADGWLGLGFTSSLCRRATPRG